MSLIQRQTGALAPVERCDDSFGHAPRDGPGRQAGQYPGRGAQLIQPRGAAAAAAGLLLELTPALVVTIKRLFYYSSIIIFYFCAMGQAW